MLKPALARGQLRCIGATTLDEYRRHIEKDAALERRFQRVLVGEPSVVDTVAILRGLRERYESHHGVRITDAAVVAAAELSNRYVTDRFLPDKAIDLVDEAAARLKIEIESKPEAVDILERRLTQLKIEREAIKRDADSAAKKRLAAIEKEIEKTQREASDLEQVWSAERARVQAVKRAQTERDRLRGEMEKAGARRRLQPRRRNPARRIAQIGGDNRRRQKKRLSAVARRGGRGRNRRCRLARDRRADRQTHGRRARKIVADGGDD